MASTTRLPTAFPGNFGPRLESGWSGVMAVFAAAALLMIPAFLSGQIVGHSGALNVSWSAEFARKFFGGEIYPRWLPGMSQGTGSPVFFYYAPLPFYLTAPFHLVVGPKMAVVIGSWLMLALSGIAFMALARAFVGSIPATIAAVVFMAMPYHLAIDVWHRAAYGEQAAYIFQPLCLLCAWRLDRGWNWAFALAAAFAGLLLSHLPSALLFAPFLTGFCLWAAWRGNWKKVIARAASAALLGGGVAAAYIGPALLFQDYIQVEFWSVHKYSSHFLFAGNESVQSSILALGLLASFKAWRVTAATSVEHLTAPWLIVVGGVALIATPLSAWLWAILPILQTVQFPFRALVIFDVAMCMILAIVMSVDGPGNRQNVVFMIVALLCVTVLIGLGHAIFGANPPDWQNRRIEVRSDAPEYLPSCRPASPYRSGYSDKLVEDDLRRASEKPDPRRLPVYYYPFLEVIADGTVVPTRCDPTTGFIVADLPEGAKTVEVRRRMLPLERNALLVSMASLAVLLGGAAWSARRPISRRAAARV